jgi:cellulose synthase/poly-beta-1,6-N-acetylglucosamine synthase-like glycosyltransferase/peptidoglycan/xylan/chitin deacetylase (PgdA/CDA1 family)/spore germination protein YaaH
MNNQIFYDPQRKRWKRLRRIMDILAVISFVVMIVFAVSVVHRQELPDLSLPATKHNYKPVIRPEEQKARALRAQRRKTARKPSDITLNSGEGLRAAYYVGDDPASYASLREHISQIDLLFPEWLHVDANTGQVLASTLDGRNYPVVDARGMHDPDTQGSVKRLIHNAKEDTEIFPLLSNFSTSKNTFDPAIGVLLQDPGRRAALRQTLMRFLNGFPAYHGFSLDFEDLNDINNAAYNAFVTELGSDLHARGLKLYVNVAHWEIEDNLKILSAASDALLLMNYDEHQNSSAPGPVAGQDWFTENLKRWLKVVPKQKIICAVGNYGYDWTLSIPNPKSKHSTSKVLGADVLSVQEAWQRAADSQVDLELADVNLNPHYEYVDEDAHVRHVVWFLDGVTVLNEMRAARALGIGTFALWRLGSEDRSLWQIWDHPRASDAPSLLAEVPPGHDVDTEGEGDILRVTGAPKPGKRLITLDTSEPDPASKLILDEQMDIWPKSYVVQQYGYHAHKLAISFDDGPDPKWTPKILDILKQQNVKAVFMMIGSQAQENVRIMQRVVAEGHEIGNHTYTHPDISEISPRQLQLELNLTERLFASKLGVQPLFFRPPYSIDQEPDTDDQAEPAARIQNLGYTIVGDKLDTNDWDENPRKTPAEITNGILAQLDAMKVKSWLRGSIILMHDGGGDRSATVAALPVLIQALRARGYEIVPVSELMGKTRAEVMPPLQPNQRLSAWVDSLAFFGLAFFGHFIVGVFFVGDVLMSVRLLLIGVLALIDRLKPRKIFQPGFEPQVAVLVPAYNEEMVIVRTIRSVLNSDYQNLRVIVIDDGSKDKTREVACEAYAAEIAEGRVTVLTKPNGGKAAALNYAIENLTEEFYVGIDADTVIAPDAVSKLIRHFVNPRIGAVAGNAKVGNRVNLWTRWQALEYITSQNFERRALDLFGIVTVVPGAIGAWRTSAVRTSGCYPMNTVAEDADLSMSLLEQKYKVIYEDSALAFTEAPINADGLMRQRFRWSFGTLQAIWKHRAAFLKNKAMGLFALPNILVFQMILPLVSPFIDLMFIAGFLHFLVDRYFHPEAASAANFQRLCVYFLAFLVIDFVTSSLAFSLERRHPANKGDGWLLFHIWLQRFAYRQVFSLVLFKTIKRAIDGRPFNWDKLERTAKMSKQTDELTRGS